MASKPNKTQETAASVDAFVAAIEPADRRADCEALCALMGRVSGEPARMWGPSIIGFGVRHYRYDSGREGDILRIGFSPRKANIALYVTGEAEGDPMVAALGKITHGKSCINVKRLADIDVGALEALIKRTLAKA
jgi:Domain of unknown function (DU1801)